MFKASQANTQDPGLVGLFILKRKIPRLAGGDSGRSLEPTLPLVTATQAQQATVT